MKNLKLAHHDPILIDLDALRRTKPQVAIDLERASARGDDAADAITFETDDPLAAIVALARRKTRR